MNIVRSLSIIALLVLLIPLPTQANPYLANPGEAPIPIRIATCAIDGGFLRELWGNEMVIHHRND